MGEDLLLLRRERKSEIKFFFFFFNKKENLFLGRGRWWAEEKGKDERTMMPHPRSV